MPIIYKIDGIEIEMAKIAQRVLPANGCAHEHVWHDFPGSGGHGVRCMDCGGSTVPMEERARSSDCRCGWCGWVGTRVEADPTCTYNPHCPGCESYNWIEEIE